MDIAVTGLGMNTSLGMTKDDCFESFCQGNTGNNKLFTLNSEKYKTQSSYEVQFGSFSDKNNRMLRATNLLCIAIKEAIESARLDVGNKRVSIYIGTGLRELRSLELWWSNEGPFSISQLHFGNAVHDIEALSEANLSVKTYSNACSASNYALALGYDALVLGESDVVIVAGTDSLSASMFGLLDKVNPFKPEQVTPFDKERKGVIIGEGAAAVVLQRGKDCKRAHAWLRGVGLSSDAYDATKPDVNGIVASISDAHKRAGISPSDIDLLMVHGTGTMQNDINEGIAVREVFEKEKDRLYLTALKSLIGHTSGSSGLHSGIAAIESLKSGRIPPTKGLRQTIDEVEGFQIVTGQEKQASLKIAQVNAFGFGGVNAVAIFEKGE